MSWFPKISPATEIFARRSGADTQIAEIGKDKLGSGGGSSRAGDSKEVAITFSARSVNRKLGKG